MSSDITGEFLEISFKLEKCQECGQFCNVGLILEFLTQMKVKKVLIKDVEKGQLRLIKHECPKDDEFN